LKRLSDISLSRKLAFSCAAVVLAWVLVEIELLVWGWVASGESGPQFPLLYQAHPYRAYAPVPNRVDRAREARFNSFGLRGPEIALQKPPNTIRVVCLGGSTTFGNSASSNTRTYPARMERLLREHYREAPFRIEVINAGVGFYSSLESLIDFETRLLDLSPGVAVVHHGINDGWFMLPRGDFRSDYSHARRTFGPPTRKWWLYSPLLSRLFGRQLGTNLYVPNPNPSLVSMIFTPPDIADRVNRRPRSQLEPPMVAAFERNLRNFISVARANGIIPVLSTQSFIDDTSAGGHWIGAVRRLNAVTLDVAVRESVDAIDFARFLPWNPDDYDDVCHLKDTPGGLGRQAEIFARRLIEGRVLERAWEQQPARSGKKR